MKISIIIPAYNEEKTLHEIVRRVEAVKFDGLDKEIVIVDDCSSDGTFEIANSLVGRGAVKVLRHEKNLGKGAALRTGFLAATGDYVCIQDADMEYNPQDYVKMLKPLEDGRADVVFGSRYLRTGNRSVLRYWHSAMNRCLTWWSNVFTDLDLSDMETCYKLFRREIIQKIAPRLKENRFGFEPEVVAEIARGMRFEGWRVSEVAIEYRPRTFTEGKKICWKDGVRALYCVCHYNAPSLPIPMQLVIFFLLDWQLLSSM